MSLAPPAGIEDVRRVMTECFKIDPSAIDADSTPETIPQWDSLGHVRLIQALELRFGVQFSAEAVADLDSVANILKQLFAHPSSRNELVPPHPRGRQGGGR